MDEDLTGNLNTALDNEISMVTTKLMNLEEREKHREAEMAEMRRMMIDQHNLIKKLLLNINKMKKATNMSTPLTE